MLSHRFFLVRCALPLSGRWASACHRFRCLTGRQVPTSSNELYGFSLKAMCRTTYFRFSMCPTAACSVGWQISQYTTMSFPSSRGQGRFLEPPAFPERVGGGRARTDAGARNQDRERAGAAGACRSRPLGIHILGRAEEAGERSFQARK
jgi:hypothetical protein